MGVVWALALLRRNRVAQSSSARVGIIPSNINGNALSYRPCYASAFAPVGQHLDCLCKWQLVLRSDITIYMPTVQWQKCSFHSSHASVCGCWGRVIGSTLMTLTCAMHNRQTPLGHVYGSCSGCTADVQQQRMTLYAAANNVGARAATGWSLH